MNIFRWDLNLGKLRTYQNRLGLYTALINFIMIAYLFIIEGPLGLPWYFWLLVVMLYPPILTYIDQRFIFHKELEFWFMSNPEWRRTTKMIREIHEEIVKNE